MALQDQVIPVSLDGSIDTKTSRKTVMAAKLLQVLNGIHTNPGEVTKRNGNVTLPTTITGGGNLASPQLFKTFQGEALVADQQQILGYSPSQSAWVPKGNYQSVDLVRSSIDQAHPASGYADCVVVGNYTVYAWSTVANRNISADVSLVYGAVVDNQSGAIVAGPKLLLTGTSDVPNPVRCVLIGGTTAGIVFFDGGFANLFVNIVTLTSGSIGFGTNTSLTSSTAISGSSSFYDVVGTAAGAALAYQTSSGIAVLTFNSSATIVNTYTLSDGAASPPFALAVDSASGNIWLHYVNTGTPGSLEMIVLSSTLSVVTAKRGTLAIPDPQIVTNIVAYTSSSGNQTVYVGFLISDPNSIYTDLTDVFSVSQAGGVTIRQSFMGVMPWSKPFQASTPSGSRWYGVFAYRSAAITSTRAFGPQSTFFLIDLAASIVPTPTPATYAPAVVGRFAAGNALTEALSIVSPGFAPTVQLINSTTAVFACGVNIQEFQSDSFEASTSAPGGLAGIFSYSFNFQSARAWQAEESGGVLILNGACPALYDGEQVSELGFHLYPEITSSSVTGSGGSIAAATYSYIAVFQWTDAEGGLHQSEYSAPFSVVVGSASSTATITVSTAYLSSKRGVSVTLFRNAPSQGAQIYYQATDPIYLTSASFASNTSFVSIVDTLSDAQLIENPPAYAYPGSAALANTVIQPFMIMATRERRLWYVDAENPNTLGYTKSYQAQVGLSPSSFLTLQMDPKLGLVAGLCELDSNMIVFKDRGKFLFAGDGADDTGANSSLTTPQILPSDQGLSTFKSLLLTPLGIFYKGPKGIYLFDRALQDHYIGADVEAYNGQAVTAVTMIPDKSQIRFLTGSGYVLYYDYLLEKWSISNQPAGLSADIYQGLYTYVGGANVYQESLTAFTDNGTGYSLGLTTSFMALAGIQGFQRIKRVAVLGSYANGSSASHALQVQFALDYGSFYGGTQSWNLGSASSSGNFQERVRTLVQKCEAMSVQITEQTTGNSGEALTLTGLALHAAVKRGLNKVLQSQSLG